MQQILSSARVKELNELKIYCIPDEGGNRMAYFIIRSWGNYLFFPHPEVKNMYPFFKAQGGIYKVYDFEIPFPFYNGDLFTVFGASTIGSKLSYHQDFLVEDYGTDYLDPDLAMKDGIFELNHKKVKLTFLDHNHSKDFYSAGELSRLALINENQ